MPPMPAFRRAADLPDQSAPDKPPTKPVGRTNKYPAKCSRCGGNVPAEQGNLDKVNDQWVVTHLDPECGTASEAPVTEPEREVNVVNGQPLYDGTYTYETLTSYRTFRLRTQAHDDDFMPGVQIIQHLVGPDNNSDYVSIGHVANGKPRIWKKHQDKATLVKDVTEFFADPQQALTAAQCFICHRTLTVPTSIHNGLGPECAKKGF